MTKTFFKSEATPSGHAEAGRVFYAAVTVIILVSVGVYLNALFNDFVYDDALQILDNPWIKDVRFLPDIFTSSVWHFKPGAEANYYRPMMHVLFMLNYHIFGLLSWGFHLINILFHASASVLIFLITRNLLLKYEPSGSSAVMAAFSAALLFATHPIHTEVVAWVAALTELSYAFFSLLSFYLYIKSEEGTKGSYALSVISFFIASFCKEQALTLPFILMAYDSIGRKSLTTGQREITPPLSSPYGRGRWIGLKRYIPYLAVSAVYLLLRFNALGGFAPYEPHTKLSPWGYIINVFPLFMQYLEKLIFPFNLNLYHVFRPISSIFEARGILSLAVTAAFVAVVVISFRRNRLVSFSLFMIVLPLLPALYIPAVGVNVFAERYLYLPTFGFVLLIASAMSRPRVAGPGLTAGLITISLVLTVVYSIGTIRRNSVWKNELTLYTDTVKKSPDASEIRYNLGLVYENHGRLDEAANEYRAAIKYDARFDRAHNNLGIVHAKQGRLNEAAGEFKTAFMLKPDHAEAHNNLGIVYADQGHLDEAIGEYMTAFRLKPDYADAHYNLGNAYVKLGRLQDAAKEFQEALRLAPGDAEARRKLEVLQGKMR